MSSEEKLKNAKAFLEAGKVEDGRKVLFDVLKDDPKNVAALLMLGGAYFYEEMFAEAEMVYEQLILLEPGSGILSVALFNTLWKHGRHDEAVEEVRRFVAVADKVKEQETLKKYAELMENIKNQE